MLRDGTQAYLSSAILRAATGEAKRLQRGRGCAKQPTPIANEEVGIFGADASWLQMDQLTLQISQVGTKGDSRQQ